MLQRCGFLVVVSVLLSSFAVAQDSAEESLSGLGRVGILNLEKVFNEYKRTHDLEARLKEIGRKKLQEVNALRGEIEKLKGEIDVLSVASRERQRREERLVEKQTEYVIKAELADRLVRERKLRFNEVLYQEIFDKVSEFGKKHGFTLIIKLEKPELRSKDMADLQVKVRDRIVLHHLDHIDISDLVLDELNKQYEEEIEEK